MGLTVTEDTPADMLAGNMELLVQLPPRIDEDYDNDEIYDGDEDDHLRQHHRNNHRHHNNNHHHNNGHHPRRGVNGNARRVTVARSTPMMDLLVQVATSQKLSASSYTLEAIGEHGLVLTHHPNTPIGALDALQVKLLPKQGTFLPIKTRHVNQPFEQTFRLQVHLPRNQLYVSRVSSRMNLGKILDEVCREKNLDRNNYDLCHPANIEETLDLSLSLQDYHLQEVTLCPKRRSLGSSLSSQDIMALQRQEERRRQEAKQSVFGFAFKKSKESSLSTDSLGERSVSPARSDGTGRSASPQAPTAPTRPQRKRRPAPKPPMPRAEPEQNADANGGRDAERERENAERMIVISHSRNSSDSSGYHEASVLSDNQDSNIRVPETLPRRSRLQPQPEEETGRTLAESSQASKSLGNLAAVIPQRATIARGTSNSSLMSTGLRKKKAAPPPPQSRPLSSAISTQALERIVDSEESLTSVTESLAAKASSDVAVESKRKLAVPRMSLGSENEGPVATKKTDVIQTQDKTDRRETAGIRNSSGPETTIHSTIANDENCPVAIIPNVDPASELHKRAVGVAMPVPKPRGAVSRLENIALEAAPKTQIIQHPSSPTERDPVLQSTSRLDHPESTRRLKEVENHVDCHAEEECRRYGQKFSGSGNGSPRPMPRHKAKHSAYRNSTGEENGVEIDGEKSTPKNKLRAVISAGDDRANFEAQIRRDTGKIPKKPRRKTAGEEPGESYEKPGSQEERRGVGPGGNDEEVPADGVREIAKSVAQRDEKPSEDMNSGKAMKTQEKSSHPSVCQKESATGTNANDVRRSCAVISTIPKCDRFEAPINARTKEKERKRTGDNAADYHSITSMDSSLGSSFGAGKSILDSNYQDIASTGTSSMTTDVTNSASEDELELESFEMFEASRSHRRVSKLVRSHSEVNDFEINTFGGNGRHLTSRSEDFAFALNPNLTRNVSDLSTDAYPEKIYKMHLSLENAAPASGKISPNLQRAGVGKIPAFLASSITWERPELLHGAQDEAARQSQAWTEGESGSVGEGPTLSTTPITKAEETTSDLLKKVSDTLSGSLRSQSVAVAAASSSLAKEHQTNAHFADQPSPELQDAGPAVNQARQLSEANENPRNKGDANEERSSIDPIESDFLNDRQPPAIKHSQYSTTSDPKQNTTPDYVCTTSTATDWEYLLPEPPTAFRDTNSVVNSEVIPSKTLLATEDVPEANYKEKPGPKGAEIVANRSEDGGRRSRTTSASSSEIGGDSTIDRSRLSRTGIKSSVDSDSRRGSQASSTPAIAPVDNTLSNFVITTYSRPKNVEIFNEIERGIRGPQAATNRKNSAPISVQAVVFADSRASSTGSLHKDVQQRGVNCTEEKLGDILTAQKSARPEVTDKNYNDLNAEERRETRGSDSDLNDTLNRSNIKISIATKPRPRGDSMNENQRPKPVFVNIGSDESSNSREDDKPDEETCREPVAGGNKKLSHWRENILNKQGTRSTEKQSQSLQVLRSILPQSDDSVDKPDSNSSEETIRVATPLSNSVDVTPAEQTVQQTSPVSSTNEPPAKRYTYAGPPAINLGSWSDRSRTTRTQIKPDKDYKVENNRTPEVVAVAGHEAPSFKKEVHPVSKTVLNATTAVQNTPKIATRYEKELVVDTRDIKREPNELAKTLIARTTASGFKRPVSMVVESSGTMMRSKKDEEDVGQKMNGDKQGKFDAARTNGGTIRRDQIVAAAKESKREEEEEAGDDRPRNFKELKEAFAKEQNTSSISMPKYGTYARRTDSYTAKSTLRRDSNVERENTITRKELQPQAENSRVQIKTAADSVQEKRSFVVVTPQANNRNGVQDHVRRTSRGNVMPVVKGFKVQTAAAAEDTSHAFSQEKRVGGYNRVAIGDISNGNYVPSQNGLRKTAQVKQEDFNTGIPKPPPTMPVITGVTLKSTNYTNVRPKSMPAEPDTRNELLESIRNFGGQNQLRRAPRRNANIVRS